MGRRRRAPLSDLPGVASLLLDAGAVLAIVRDKQQVRRWIEHADGLGVDPRVSLVTVAEVFRDRPAAARVQWVLSRLDKEPVTLGHAWDAGRLLGHEDVDLFTILPASRVDGLQVWNHRAAKWVRMRAPYGSIIINTGDYMQRISNDRLPSTTHRVGKPSDGSHLKNARVSFPMNVYLWEDEILEVLPGLGAPKYPPIKAITFHTRSTSKFYGDDYAVD